MKRLLFLTLLIFASIFSGCEKVENNQPTVKTLKIHDVAKTSARVTATFIDISCPEQPQRGVCWSTSPSPTITNSKTVSSACNGGETVDITDLTSKTIYYVRAYCLSKNNDVVIYGNELSFTTQ